MIFNVLEEISIETPEGIENLKSGQVIRLSKDEAMPVIEAGVITPLGKVAYKVYSEILQAFLVHVDTDDDMHSLRSQGVTEAIYTRQDIAELKKIPKEALKDIHKIKEVFLESTIESVTKK